MPTRTNAVRSRGSHADALTDRHPNHQTARRLALAAGLCVAGLMCTPKEAMAQGQLVYSQLGIINNSGSSQNEQTWAWGAPSIDADGTVAYRRGRAAYLAGISSITPVIEGGYTSTGQLIRVVDQADSSPRISDGVVYLASARLGGPYLYRSTDRSVETIISPGQLLDATTGARANPRAQNFGYMSAQGNRLTGVIDTLLPDDPYGISRPAIFRVDGQQTTLVTQLVDSIAPGTNQPFSIERNAFYSRPITPILDRQGRVIFTSYLNTYQTATRFTSGIWSHTADGSLTALYLPTPNTSDPVPDAFSGLSVNSQGDILFRTPTNGQYVRSNSTGALRQVSTSAAFSIPNNQTYSRGLLNDSGAVLSLVGASSVVNGVRTELAALTITHESGAQQVIARSGDRLPGFASLFFGAPSPVGSQIPTDSARVESFSSQRGFNSIAFGALTFNNLNQAVFLANFTDGTAFARLALVAYDPLGGLSTLAVTGRPLPALGLNQTIVSIDFIGDSNTTSGHATGLNDQGLVAFRASFNDGSSRLITVQLPTPGALTTLALASMLATRRRRAR